MAITRFRKVIAAESIFGRCKWIDQFGFPFIRYVTQYDVAHKLQSHDSPTCISLTACKVDGLADVSFNGIFRKLLLAKERGINRFYILRLWLGFLRFVMLHKCADDVRNIGRRCVDCNFLMIVKMDCPGSVMVCAHAIAVS